MTTGIIDGPFSINPLSNMQSYSVKLASIESWSLTALRMAKCVAIKMITADQLN